MITITIHTLSFVVGMLFGAFITMGTVLKLFYDDRWDNGFSAGFDAALKMKEAEDK